jgi:hypothetical protein
MGIKEMTISEKFDAIKTACDKQFVCEIHINDEPAVRIIQPLGVCLTARRGLVVVCWQTDGHSSKSLPSTCNFSLDDCISIRSIGKTFRVEKYADDPEYCRDWLVHIEPHRLVS